MSIAINVRFLLPGKLEGLGWYTHEIVRRMVLNHPEQTFYFLFDRPYDPAFIYADNVRPIVLFPPARHPFLWYWWFEFSVPAALKRCGAEVFFSPDSYCSLRSPVPTVMTVHDLAPLHPAATEKKRGLPQLTRKYYEHFLPKFIERAEAIPVVSEFVRQDVLNTCHTPPDKVHTVYNGARDNFRPFSEAEQAAIREKYSNGQPYFFYNGAIHPRKNIARLIEAFNRFKQQSGAPLKLLLAGRLAWNTEAVTEAAAQSPFRDDIHLLGYVPEAELPGLLGAALALTYVSFSEGFGLPLVEAMQSDVPVIAANTTALPEVAGDAALLVNPHSEDEIAAAMHRVWQDEALRRDLIARGRTRRQAFSWDLAAEQIYQLLLQNTRPK